MTRALRSLILGGLFVVAVDVVSRARFTAPIARRLPPQVDRPMFTPSFGILCSACPSCNRKTARARCFWCLDALCVEHSRRPLSTAVDACVGCAASVKAELGDTETLKVDDETAELWRYKYGTWAA